MAKKKKAKARAKKSPRKKIARKTAGKTARKKTKKKIAKAKKKVVKRPAKKVAKKAKKKSTKKAGKTARESPASKKKTGKKVAAKKTPQKKTSGGKSAPAAKRASAGAAAGPKVGQKIKDYELPVAGAPGELIAGATRRLSELAGLRGMVLYFYPKDSTPGCTVEACDFRDNLGRLTATGFQPVGVSADSIASHQKFATKQNLNFPLISDENKTMLSGLGLWVEKSMYGRTFMGIPRTTLILDQTLTVRHVYEKVSPKGHVDQILGDIAGLD